MPARTPLFLTSPAAWAAYAATATVFGADLVTYSNSHSHEADEPQAATGSSDSIQKKAQDELSKGRGNELGRSGKEESHARGASEERR